MVISCIWINPNFIQIKYIIYPLYRSLMQWLTRRMYNSCRVCNHMFSLPFGLHFKIFKLWYINNMHTFVDICSRPYSLHHLNFSESVYFEINKLKELKTALLYIRIRCKSPQRKYNYKSEHKKLSKMHVSIFFFTIFL